MRAADVVNPSTWKRRRYCSRRCASRRYEEDPDLGAPAEDSSRPLPLMEWPAWARFEDDPRALCGDYAYAKIAPAPVRSPVQCALG